MGNGMTTADLADIVVTADDEAPDTRVFVAALVMQAPTDEHPSFVRGLVEHLLRVTDTNHNASATWTRAQRSATA